MFIDYLTLIMINTITGIALLGQFLWKGLDDEAEHRSYAPAFGGVGFLALFLGLAMSITWPLPGSHNIYFGGATTLFGVVFLVTAFSLNRQTNLVPTTTLAFFAGIYALLAGVNMLVVGSAQQPPAAAFALLLSGLIGVSAAPYLMFFKESKMLRRVALVALLLTASMWMILFVASFWVHLSEFAAWMPK